MKKEKEILDIVNTEDVVIGCKDKELLYQEGNHNYRVVNIFVVNEKNEILLSKRKKDVDRFKDAYDFSAGGHVKSGETYEDAAIRELYEELGISVHQEELIEIGYLKYSNIINTSSFSKLYVLKDKGFFFQKEDAVEKIAYCAVSKIEDMLCSSQYFFKSDYPMLFQLLKSCYINEEKDVYSIVTDYEICKLLQGANQILEKTGYVDHGMLHVARVLNRCRYLCKAFDIMDELKEIEVAALLHDIGNCVNRKFHELIGAQMAYSLLEKKGFDMAFICKVIGLIGNHDYNTGIGYSKAAVTLIVADKTDFIRKRVIEKQEVELMNEYEKMHYSIVSNELVVNENKVVLLVEIDRKIGTIEEFYKYTQKESDFVKNSLERHGMEYVVQCKYYSGE